MSFFLQLLLQNLQRFPSGHPKRFCKIFFLNHCYRRYTILHAFQRLVETFLRLILPQKVLLDLQKVSEDFTWSSENFGTLIALIAFRKSYFGHSFSFQFFKKCFIRIFHMIQSTCLDCSFGVISNNFVLYFTCLILFLKFKRNFWLCSY